MIGIVSQWRQRYKHSTTYEKAATLRHLLRHLQQFGAHRISTPRIALPPPRAVTLADGERDKLLAAAPPHLQLFIRLCSELALRFMEAYRVTPGDHDPEARTVRVRVKGGKSRTMPTTPEIDLLITTARLSNPTAPAIETLHGRPLAATTLRGHFHDAVKTSGINQAITPHDLRRTTATLLYRLTKDLQAVQQVLGHSRLTSTLHYIAPMATENLSPLLQQLYHPRHHKETVQ